jgi:hypothetical protein
VTSLDSLNDLVLFVVDFDVFLSARSDLIVRSDATLFTSLLDDDEALVVTKRLDILARTSSKNDDINDFVCLERAE